MLNNNMTEQYISETYGNKSYYKDPAKTIQHRLDGPTVEYANGDKAWFVNSKRHRLDGPAAETAKGEKVWFVNDVFIFAVDKDGKIVDRMKD